MAACEIKMHCPPSKLWLKFHWTTISVISSRTKSVQYLPMAWKNWSRRFWKRPIYHSKIKSYHTCATHKCWKNSNDFMAFGDQKISKILGALLLEISKTKRWVKYSRLRDEGNHLEKNWELPDVFKELDSIVSKYHHYHSLSIWSFHGICSQLPVEFTEFAFISLIVDWCNIQAPPLRHFAVAEGCRKRQCGHGRAVALCWCRGGCAG